MTVTLADILQAVNGPNGVLALIVIIGVLVMHGDLALGRELRKSYQENKELKQENQELRQVAYRTNLTADEARTLTRRLVDALETSSPDRAGSEAPWER